MTVLPCPSHLSPPVFAELQQADVITPEECEEYMYDLKRGAGGWGLNDPSRVVKVQSGKSPEVLTKTADVLRRHGFEKDSNLLTSK